MRTSRRRIIGEMKVFCQTPDLAGGHVMLQFPVISIEFRYFVKQSSHIQPSSVYHSELLGASFPQRLQPTLCLVPWLTSSEANKLHHDNRSYVILSNKNERRSSLVETIRARFLSAFAQRLGSLFDPCSARFLKIGNRMGSLST